MFFIFPLLYNFPFFSFEFCFIFSAIGVSVMFSIVSYLSSPLNYYILSRLGIYCYIIGFGIYIKNEISEVANFGFSYFLRINWNMN